MSTTAFETFELVPIITLAACTLAATVVHVREFVFAMCVARRRTTHVVNTMLTFAVPLLAGGTAYDLWNGLYVSSEETRTGFIVYVACTTLAIGLRAAVPFFARANEQPARMVCGTALLLLAVALFSILPVVVDTFPHALSLLPHAVAIVISICTDCTFIVPPREIAESAHLINGSV